MDVFDGSYPYSATDQGRALVFPVPSPSAMSRSAEEGGEGERGVSTGGDEETDSPGGECVGMPGLTEIDLREERFVGLCQVNLMANTVDTAAFIHTWSNAVTQINLFMLVEMHYSHRSHPMTPYGVIMVMVSP